MKRIRGEMDKVIASTGFKGDFHAFTKYLLTDPKFYYTDAESLLAGYRDIAKQIDPKLVEFFGILPRLPYGIQAVPAYAEKSQAGGYYEPGSLKAGRPGYFFAEHLRFTGPPKMGNGNAHPPRSGAGTSFPNRASRRRWKTSPSSGSMADTTRSPKVGPSTRKASATRWDSLRIPTKTSAISADEMLRAVRLVVDTGLHSMDWTREQAIKYFEENTGNPPHDIEVEVDRYIVWPSQALGYKIGQLKIRELRSLCGKRARPKVRPARLPR